MTAPHSIPDPDALCFQGGRAPFVLGNQSRLLIPSLPWKSGASYLVGGGFQRPTLDERGAPVAHSLS